MDSVIQTFRALSEEMRLRILMLLIGGELCVCDLMAIFGESQSKVSRHLAYLKHSGLVKGTRVGRWMHYSLEESLEEVAAAQLRFMEEHLSLLPQFRQDRQKLGEVQRKKLCEGVLGAHRP